MYEKGWVYFTLERIIRQLVKIMRLDALEDAIRLSRFKSATLVRVFSIMVGHL